MNRNAAILLVLGAFAPFAHALEGFENVPALFSTGGWAQSNLSNPVGLTSPWTQGNAANLSSFPAFSGTPNSYINANFEAVNDRGTISAWLFAPTQTFFNGDRIQFYTRTTADSTFADRLQVRFSGSGTSTDVGTTENSVGNFTNLLLDINPTLAPAGYPHDWTVYNLTLSGLTAPTSGRLAFRYLVTDGGASGANSNLIGIDSFNVQTTPEPGTLAALGLGIVAIARRRKVTR